MFCAKVLDKTYFISLIILPRHPVNDSLKSTNLSLLMSELCSFLCFKLYSLHFANAHAQKSIVMLIRIGHNCVA